MKIKIEPNEITFRLRDEDFDELRAKGKTLVILKVHDTRLDISMELQQIEAIDIKLVENEIQLFFPKSLFQDWMASEKIGYRASVGEIIVFVEKDLVRKRNKLRGN